MTKGSRLLAAVASVVFVLATPALAASGGKSGALAGAREVEVSKGALFNGQELAEGTYRLSWELNGGGDRVEVRLLKGKRVLATVAGRVVERGGASPYDSVVYTRDGRGKLTLAEIRFAGSRSAISLQNEAVGLAESR